MKLVPLLRLASERQRLAYRPGTLKNRQSALKAFISFAVEMKFKYDDPAPEHICAYMEYLIQRGLSPGGIKNHISNLKGFFTNASISTLPFESKKVYNASRGIDLSLKHSPKIKVALKPDELAKIVKVIDTYEQGPMASFAIVIMFTALIRQSNILAKTVATFDPERQLTCNNVLLADGGLLQIDLRWSKTNQRFGESTIVTAAAIPGSTLCPVTRYIQTQDVERRRSSLPLIRFADNHPMTLSFVNKYCRLAIASTKLTIPNLTLHKLRLSGATWASQNGVDHLHICQQGTWRSEAFRSYVVRDTTIPSQVNNSMSGIVD